MVEQAQRPGFADGQSGAKAWLPGQHEVQLDELTGSRHDLAHELVDLGRPVCRQLG